MNRKWESIKQEYLFAETFEDRRVVAIHAANIAWAMTGAKERFPTRQFLAKFLEASFQYEKKNFQLDELHHIKQHVEKNREIELDQAKVYWSKEFIKQLEKQSKKQ
jgi:hypothetical protein